MYCRKCGKQLPEESSFCPFCGVKIETSGPEKPPEAVEASEKKRKRIWIILVTCLALAVIAAAILLYHDYGPGSGASAASAAAAPQATVSVPYASSKAPDVDADYNPDIEADFISFGDVTFDSEHLYFVGLFDDKDDHTSVYATDLSGGGKTLLSANGDIWRIRSAGQKLYYQAYDENGAYSIGCFNKDGSAAKTILRFDSGCTLWYFTVTGDTLYYTLDDDFHSCDLSGGNDKTLLTGVYSACVGNNVYYVDSDSVSVYHLKDKSTDRLCAAVAYTLLYDDKTLYFTTLDGLYCVPAAGGNVKCLVKSEYISPRLAIKGDYILYVKTYTAQSILLDQDNDDDPKGMLYAVSKNGGDPVKCSGRLLCAVFVTPGKAYYLSSFTDYNGKVFSVDDMLKLDGEAG